MPNQFNFIQSAVLYRVNTVFVIHAWGIVSGIIPFSCGMPPEKEPFLYASKWHYSILELPIWLVITIHCQLPSPLFNDNKKKILDNY